MSGGKETPRQKMIGMMYLVLTAMLALNVSTAILKSFLIVNDSIEATNRNFESKVESSYNIFEKAYAENKEKVQENYNKAQEAKRLTEEFRNYLSTTKSELISLSAKVPKEIADTLSPHDISRQDDYDSPTLFFIEQGRGKDVREKIDEFEGKMLGLLPENERSIIKSAFNTKGPFHDASGKEVNWETANFYQSIIVAAITTLNKLENDAMNLEYDVVNALYSLVSAGDFKFSDVVAKIVPKSSYVLVGEAFEAEIFIVAFDKKATITGIVNGQRMDSKDGVITYKTSTSREGLSKVSGHLNLPGDPQPYPFSTEYIVASPMATISADAMNVLYIGVDNPISIAASGDANTITAEISGCGGTLTKTGTGTYTAHVASAGKATISVYMKNGTSSKLMGSREYRVKKVPDPLALVNGVDEYTTIVDRNILSNSGGLVARLKDFDFALNVRVSSFTMGTNVGGEFIERRSTTNRFTDDMLNLMRNARKGQKFFFDDIKCQMPTGVVTLRTFTLTIR